MLFAVWSIDKMEKHFLEGLGCETPQGPPAWWDNESFIKDGRKAFCAVRLQKPLCLCAVSLRTYFSAKSWFQNEAFHFKHFEAKRKTVRSLYFNLSHPLCQPWSVKDSLKSKNWQKRLIDSNSLDKKKDQLIDMRDFVERFCGIRSVDCGSRYLQMREKCTANMDSFQNSFVLLCRYCSIVLLCPAGSGDTLSHIVLYELLHCVTSVCILEWNRLKGHWFGFPYSQWKCLQ